MKMRFSEDKASRSIKHGHLPQLGTWVGRDCFEAIALDVDFEETRILSGTERTLLFTVLHLN